MDLIDSHIHLDFAAFDEDRRTLVEQARSAGIKHFVVPATTRPSWTRIQQLSVSMPRIYAAYGIHPYFAHEHSLADCAALDHWLEENSCIAVGEIGLDFFLRDLDRQHQITLFDAQLLIARNHALPVILHARKAVEEVTIRLKEYGLKQGIVHSFNGSEVQAWNLVELGFKLGFGGALTYPRATRLRAMVQRLPLEAICLETDAPDQATLGFEGVRNQPIALLEVLEVVAELREMPVDVIAQHTTRNTYAALNLNSSIDRYDR